MCPRSPIFILAVLVSLALANVTSRAQELDANVVVVMDAIPADLRQDLQSMASDVKNYLNNERYSGQEWEGLRIPVDITIYILSRNGNDVSARLGIVSKRLVNNQAGTGGAMLRVLDSDWQFKWTFNPTLTYQPTRYESFVSVLDFYMIVAIGLDMDTYDDVGGSNMFSVAKQIAQLGNAQGVKGFKTFSQPGEFTRMALINELTDLRYEGLRRIFFDYHDAIDLYAKDAAKGRVLIAQVIGDLANFKRTKLSNRSVLLQAFFDAKNIEIAAIFRGQRESEVWNDLRFLDGSNTTAYEQARLGNK
ncbi:MAG: DUF4835 family protein [bacterium]|nr:DUF4835 family protein [bacterium]